MWWVQVQAGEEVVDTAAATLAFDPAILQVVSVTQGAAFTTVIAENTYDNNTGQIEYVAGSPGGSATGTFTLMTVRFEAISQTTAGSPIIFSTSGTTLSDAIRGGESLLSSTTGATVFVEEVPTATPTPTVTATPTITLTPTVTPTPTDLPPGMQVLSPIADTWMSDTETTTNYGTADSVYTSRAPHETTRSCASI